MTDDPRCLASADFGAGWIKRCVKATGHPGLHLWLEAEPSEGMRRVVEWDDARNVHSGYWIKDA